MIYSPLYNSAAVYHRGVVAGLYRKVYPAIRSSVYRPGDQLPVFTIGGLTFGIVICNDSNYIEPARVMAAQGAAAIFIPTHNALPPDKADVVALARNTDIARAIENSVAVIRADVAGEQGSLLSYGSTQIINPDGGMLASSTPLTHGLIVADISTIALDRRRGWDASRNPAVTNAYRQLFASDNN